MNLFQQRKSTSKSNYELNKDIVKYSTWNEQAIIDRTEKLCEKFISAWPYFGLATVKDNNVTGSSPRILFIGDESIKVKVWREVLEHTIIFIYQELLNTRKLLFSVENNPDMRRASHSQMAII